MANIYGQNYNYGNSMGSAFANGQQTNPYSFANNPQINPYGFNNQQQRVNDGTFMTVLVQGEAGANAYPVASGNTVLLMDFDSGKFWLKSNVNGIPQRLRAFSFVENTEEQQGQSTINTNATVTRDEFNALSQNVSRISENVNKLINDLGGASNE